MSVYTFLACDLRTNAILAELPLRDVTFSSVLNGAGELSASLDLGDARVTKLDPWGVTQPRRTALYVDRDGVLVWGGIIWTRRPVDAGDAVHLELGGNEFLSYLARRRIRQTLTYAATDQLAIARALVNYAQGVAGGDIGITVGAETSGIARDRTYFDYERKQILEALTQLSTVDNGFDLGVDVVWSGSTPTKTLRLSYPQRGRIAPATELLWEYPRPNVTGYTWPEDGTQSANLVDSVGGGEAESALISTAALPAEIDAGFPLLEAFTSYTDISDQVTLDAHARADVASSFGDAITPVITVRADLEPVVGAYIVGDAFRFRATSNRHPANADGSPGLDTYLRIASMTVKPSDGGELEAVTLTAQTI